MINNPWVWALVLAVVGVVLVVALWRGRGADVTVGLRGLQLRTPGKPERSSVRVANEARVLGEVQTITGRDGAAATNAPGDVVVADGIVVGKGGSVGEIVGERITSAVPARSRDKTK